MQAKSRSAKSSKKASAKKASAKTQSAKARQLMDDVLMRVNPQVQKSVDQVFASLNNTKEARMGDLKWLAGQILLRSKDISEQIKKVSKSSPQKAAEKVARAAQSSAQKVAGVLKKSKASVKKKTPAKKAIPKAAKK